MVGAIDGRRDLVRLGDRGLDDEREGDGHRDRQQDVLDEPPQRPPSRRERSAQTPAPTPTTPTAPTTPSQSPSDGPESSSTGRHAGRRALAAGHAGARDVGDPGARDQVDGGPVELVVAPREVERLVQLPAAVAAVDAAVILRVGQNVPPVGERGGRLAEERQREHEDERSGASEQDIHPVKEAGVDRPLGAADRSGGPGGGQARTAAARTPQIIGVAALAGWAALAAAGGGIDPGDGLGGDGPTGAFLALAIGAPLAAVAVVLAWDRAALRSGPARLALAAMAGIALWSGLSIAWAAGPDLAWIDANREAVALCALALGVSLGALVPRAPLAFGLGLSVAALVPVVWALGTKVVPGLLGADRDLGRLAEPVGYWNALALIAAFALPGLLWLAGDRRRLGAAARGGGHRPLRRRAGADLLARRRAGGGHGGRRHAGPRARARAGGRRARRGRRRRGLAGGLRAARAAAVLGRDPGRPARGRRGRPGLAPRGRRRRGGRPGAGDRLGVEPPRPRRGVPPALGGARRAGRAGPRRRRRRRQPPGARLGRQPHLRAARGGRRRGRQHARAAGERVGQPAQGLVGRGVAGLRGRAGDRAGRRRLLARPPPGAAQRRRRARHPRGPRRRGRVPLGDGAGRHPAARGPGRRGGLGGAARGAGGRPARDRPAARRGRGVRAAGVDRLELVDPRAHGAGARRGGDRAGGGGPRAGAGRRPPSGRPRRRGARGRRDPRRGERRPAVVVGAGGVRRARTRSRGATRGRRSSAPTTPAPPTPSPWSRCCCAARRTPTSANRPARWAPTGGPWSCSRTTPTRGAPWRSSSGDGRASAAAWAQVRRLDPQDPEAALRAGPDGR